jgi:hypothetical protein
MLSRPQPLSFRLNHILDFQRPLPLRINFDVILQSIASCDYKGYQLLGYDAVWAVRVKPDKIPAAA